MAAGADGGQSKTSGVDAGAATEHASVETEPCDPEVEVDVVFVFPLSGLRRKTIGFPPVILSTPVSMVACFFSPQKKSSPACCASSKNEDMKSSRLMQL